LAGLHSKQLATLPFGLIAAVKNTTPLVGSADSGVRAFEVTPETVFDASSATAALESATPEHKSATLASAKTRRFIEAPH